MRVKAFHFDVMVIEGLMHSPGLIMQMIEIASMENYRFRVK